MWTAVPLLEVHASRGRNINYRDSIKSFLEWQHSLIRKLLLQDLEHVQEQELELEQAVTNLEVS